MKKLFILLFVLLIGVATLNSKNNPLITERFTELISDVEFDTEFNRNGSGIYLDYSWAHMAELPSSILLTAIVDRY